MSTTEEEPVAATEALPPTGEEIHLPGPSILPLLTAIGITLTLVGVTLNHALTVIGLLITIPVLWRWVRSSNADIDELPLEHHVEH
jgi:hypothetical protein